MSEASPVPHGAVVLLGPPGAGKGTIARRLAAEHGLVHLDTGRLLRERAESGDPVGDRIAIAQALGVMVSTELVLEVLCSRLEQLPADARVVLDGFPRTRVQVAAIDDGRVPLRVDVVIWLDVDEHIALDRLRERRAQEHRDDDAGDVIHARLRLVDETVGVVRATYEERGLLEVVNARVDVDEVYRQVCERAVPLLSMA